jgi:hypothetical protein
MDNVYEWGLSVIRLVQQTANPVLIMLMKCITFAGNPDAYIVVLPLVYWCIDERKGYRLGCMVITCGAINTILKNWLCVPRPYQRDPSVGLSSESSWSTPSGHSQSSALFWPLFATLFPAKRKSVRMAIAIIPPLLIGFTRVYLGVHYPTDVLFGWLIGSMLFIGTWFLWDRIADFLVPLRKSFKILLLAGVVILLNLLSPSDTSMPGALFGFGTGYFLMNGTRGFAAASGTIIKKILRFILGIALLGLVYLGLKKVFPVTGHPQYHLFRFVRYVLTGFAASYVIPLLFVKMKLVDPRFEDITVDAIGTQHNGGN